MPIRICLRLTPTCSGPRTSLWRNSQYAILSLLASASCQAVFSSELTNDSSSDANTADSQSPTTVTVEFTALHVPNDSAGAPLPTRIPAALQSVDIAVSFDNGVTTTKPMVDTTTGIVRFERPTPTTPYLLLVNAAPRLPVAGMYGTAAQGYESLYVQSRMGAEPVGAATNRLFYLPVAPGPVGHVIFATTGVTTETDIGADTERWWGNAKGPGANDLPDAAAGDQGYANGFTVVGSLYRLTHSAHEPFSLTRANFQFGPTSYKELTLRTTRLRAPLQDLQGLLASAQPTGGHPTAQWRVIAVPISPDLSGFHAPPAGPLLAFNTATTPANSDIDLGFGNPFTGTTPIVKLRAQRDYGYRARETPMGNSNLFVFLPSFAEVYTPIDPDSGSGAHLFASFARNISVNGKLVNVSTTQSVGNGPLTIAWRGLMNENADAFAVTLIKLISSGGPTTAVEMATFRTTEHALTIPAAVVSPGEYVLAVEAWRGLPGAAQGDFRPQTLPAARTRVLTSIFTVQ